MRERAWGVAVVESLFSCARGPGAGPALERERTPRGVGMGRAERKAVRSLRGFAFSLKVDLRLSTDGSHHEGLFQKQSLLVKGRACPLRMGCEVAQ